VVFHDVSFGLVTDENGNGKDRLGKNTRHTVSILPSRDYVGRIFGIETVCRLLK
jgi:hypothetical protein